MPQTALHEAGVSDPGMKHDVARDRTTRQGRFGKRLWLLAKLLLAGGAFAFILSRQPWSELTTALAQLTPAAFLLSVSISVVCLAVATLRWRLLMHAYGATALPRFWTLFRVYFVGQFYNTYLPGGVGGDVLRGVVTRRSFGGSGATSGVAIVFVERALGLLGVVGVLSLAAPFGADEALRRTFLPYCALGLLAVAGVVSAVAVGRRLAALAPKRLARLLHELPQLQRAWPFAVACLLSLVTQSLVALGGHVLVSSIYPEARFVESLIATPLATGAAFLPISVAGAGPRDLVLVALYVALGIPRAAGAATALALLLSTLLVSGLGGILQLLAPLSPVSPPSPRENVPQGPVS